MSKDNQIEKYLKAFIDEKGIQGFSPSTIQQIADMDKGDLWNLVCNLVEAYFEKHGTKNNAHCFICKHFSLEDVGYDICTGYCKADNYKMVVDNYKCDKYEEKD